MDSNLPQAKERVLLTRPLGSTNHSPSSTPLTRTKLELIETIQSLAQSLLVVPRRVAKTLDSGNSRSHSVVTLEDEVDPTGVQTSGTSHTAGYTALLGMVLTMMR